MTKFEDLKAEHQRLLAEHDAGGDAAILLVAAQDYIQRIRLESEQVRDPRDRDQLRAYLRFWGAYLYDQTGTYPDTSLRPATLGLVEIQEPSAPRQNFLTRYWVWLLGIVCVVAVLAALYFGLGNRRMMAALERTPTALSVEENGTEIAAEPDRSPTPDASEESVVEIGTEEAEMAYAENAATLTLAPKPNPTATPFPTDPLRPTETVTVVPTQVTEAMLPNTSIPDSVAPPSGTGNLPSLMLGAEVTGAQNADWCTSRYLEVSVSTPNFVFGSNSSLTLRIDPAGDQQSFGQEISRLEPIVRIDLLRLQAVETYSLLHMEHPKHTSTDVIFRYGADCASDQLQVVFQMTEKDTPEIESPRSPDVALGWNFITWGPEPFRGGSDNLRWFALLELSAQGGDGTYVYWKPDEYGNLGLSETNQVLVYGDACQLASIVAAVTSAGQTVTREIVLQAPYCPATRP